MSDPSALVLDDCCYYHPDCSPSSETGDSPIGMYDEDVAKYKGDIYCEGCGLVINNHLTDHHEAWGASLA